jgi:hypothetical protein
VCIPPLITVPNNPRKTKQKSELYEIYALQAEMRRYCQTKGYREGPGINNFIPHDVVDTFGMAKHLVTAGFDKYL